MTELSDEDINKRIAEFEGWRKIQKDPDNVGGPLVGLDPDNRFGKYAHQKWPIPSYTNSLDSLIPPLEKFYKETNAVGDPYKFRLTSTLDNGWLVETIWHHHDGDIPISKLVDKSPSRALALALCKAIEEIIWKIIHI